MLPKSEQLAKIIIIIINAGKDVEKKELIHHWWERQLVQALWRMVWRFCK
jgi:hypothetical protein